MRNEKQIQAEQTAGKRSAFRAAFPFTIPVMAGYVFLGMTYGVLMRTSGFPWWLPMLTALVIYTGSMEFLMTSILASSFHPLSAFMTAIMVGARHLFYGISLLGTYRNMGWKKFYLIYTTSDETFSVIYTTPVPEGIRKDRFYFWISFLDQMYWVSGSLIGGILGGLITFDVEGLDFVMTAMFVVILMNQWVKDGTKWKTIFRDHIPELTGIVGSVIALVIFGPDNFMIPAMILILAALLLMRGKLDSEYPPKHFKMKRSAGGERMKPDQEKQEPDREKKPNQERQKPGRKKKPDQERQKPGWEQKPDQKRKEPGRNETLPDGQQRKPVEEELQTHDRIKNEAEKSSQMIGEQREGRQK